MAFSFSTIFKDKPTAVLFTTLVAGTLDGLAAIIQYLIKGGKTPEVIFKYIASGVFGKKAFSGGIPMVFWGVLYHYLAAFLFTAFFFWIYPFFKSTSRYPVVTGLLYGICVWTVMNMVVMPLSRVNQQPPDLAKSLVPVLIIMFCIGLPVSLMANKHYLYKK